MEKAPTKMITVIYEDEEGVTTIKSFLKTPRGVSYQDIMRLLSHLGWRVTHYKFQPWDSDVGKSPTDSGDKQEGKGKE
jgi:hypothetical protein